MGKFEQHADDAISDDEANNGGDNDNGDDDLKDICMAK